MDHHRVRIGRIDGHNRRRPAAANVRIANPMRGEVEIVPNVQRTSGDLGGAPLWK